MVNANETLITSVAGTRGTAEVIEVLNPSTNQAEYQVRFNGAVENFKSMGEAYITAKEKAGYQG